MKYIALLRGINVGLKNRLSMAQLKQVFESIGFKNVTTYINSGNVIFEADEQDVITLIQLCEAAIEKDFGFHVICSVISAKDLADAISHAPSWWGKDADSSHNAMFVITPATPKIIMKAAGEPNAEYEQLSTYRSIIFWSAPVKTFGRTRYSKMVSQPVYQSITIRNANTARKLVELSI